MANVLPFFLFFVSGWCSLVYEVIWSRMLILVLGNTTLATTTILAAFMLGLSIGSIYWGRWIESGVMKISKIWFVLVTPDDPGFVP